MLFGCDRVRLPAHVFDRNDSLGFVDVGTPNAAPFFGIYDSVQSVTSIALRMNQLPSPFKCSMIRGSTLAFQLCAVDQTSELMSYTDP